MPEEPVVAVFVSGGAEFWGRGVGFGASIEDSNNLVSVDELGMLVASNIGYCRKCLFDHVGDNALGLSWSVVIDGHAIAEYTKRPGKVIGLKLNVVTDRVTTYG